MACRRCSHASHPTNSFCLHGSSREKTKARRMTVEWVSSESSRVRKKTRLHSSLPTRGIAGSSFAGRGKTWNCSFCNHERDRTTIKMGRCKLTPRAGQVMRPSTDCSRLSAAVSSFSANDLFQPSMTLFTHKASIYCVLRSRSNLDVFWFVQQTSFHASFYHHHLARNMS